MVVHLRRTPQGIEVAQYRAGCTDYKISYDTLHLRQMEDINVKKVDTFRGGTELI